MIRSTRPRPSPGVKHRFATRLPVAFRKHQICPVITHRLQQLPFVEPVPVQSVADVGQIHIDWYNNGAGFLRKLVKFTKFDPRCVAVVDWDRTFLNQCRVFAPTLIHIPVDQMHHLNKSVKWLDDALRAWFEVRQFDAMYE